MIAWVINQILTSIARANYMRAVEDYDNYNRWQAGRVWHHSTAMVLLQDLQSKERVLSRLINS